MTTTKERETLSLEPTALRHALQDRGGFTVDPTTGDIPTTGYAVALPGYERVYPAALLTASDLWSGLQDARIAAHYSAFHVYYGAWRDPETDLVYLDASIVTEFRDLALQLAREGSQLAIYDIAAGESIRLEPESPFQVIAELSVGGES